MLIKFINTGKGSAGSAKEYLLREHDHKGEVRADIQVLRGNPDQVTAVAESLEFKHTYRSAVIAWHKDDQPTDEQISEVLDEFERVAFSGLDPNQYTYYAVLHQESDGSKHVHIITPRVELQTGKSMNIAPPGWHKTYDLIRDLFNTRYDWASPKDRGRRQSVTLDKTMIHSDMPSAEAKKLLSESVNQAIRDGLVTDHASVKAYLAKFGEITREGKDYVSVKPKGFKRAIRLKGGVYEREFSIERVSRELEAEQRAGVSGDQADREREVKRLEQALRRTVAQRAEYNSRRYDYTALRSAREVEQSTINNHQAGERSAQRDPVTEKEDPSRDQGDRGYRSFYSDEVAELTLDELRDLCDDELMDALRDLEHGLSDEARHTGSVQQREAGDHGGAGEDVAVRELHTPPNSGRVAIDREEAGGGIDDRVRARVTGYSQDATRDLYAGVAKRHRTVRAELERDHGRLSDTDREIKQLFRRAEQSHQRSFGAIEKIRERVGRRGDQFRSAVAGIFEQSAQQIAQQVGRIGEARQEFSRAVKRCVARAVDKIQEIHEQYVSRSRGPTMMR